MQPQPYVDEIFRLQRVAELQEQKKISSYHGIGIRVIADDKHETIWKGITEAGF
jgi:hypothetical protein